MNLMPGPLYGLHVLDVILLANSAALAPPHPTGAINLAPTHWPSLRSAFMANSPTISM
jgi:hypothetical protein